MGDISPVMLEEYNHKKHAQRLIKKRGICSNPGYLCKKCFIPAKYKLDASKCTIGIAEIFAEKYLAQLSKSELSRFIAKEYSEQFTVSASKYKSLW